MKKLFLLLFILSITSTAIFAQEMPFDSKADSLLTKKEAELRIQAFQAKVKSLEDQYNSVHNRYLGLKTELDNINKSLKDCNDEVLRLIGATQADVDAFRQSLGVIEARVRELQRLNDDQLIARQDEVKQLEYDLNALRSNQLSMLPEFYNKIISLARDIKGLYREKKITTYTVGTWAENRDCLWNIAGNIEIYADPFMWPKIWQANKDQIRNPDIIHPGQVLTIPEKGPKSSDEMKAERRYWRNKKAAQEQKNDAQPGASN